ncbi:DUF4358 domain-containing protein [Clostridiales bacterium]|nr:DUF4358 domain-containing protein [Clostridiales bacterium]
MKRIMLLLLAAMLLVLDACSAPEKGAPASDAPASLAEKVNMIAEDAGNLAALTAEDLEDVLGAVPADYTEFVFLQSEGMDGRELLAVRAADRDAAGRVAGMAEAYLERRLKETRNYAPEAYKLLSEAKVRTKNLTVVLAVGPNGTQEADFILAGE